MILMEINKGLEGVIVGETTISSIDGMKGRLIYKGYSIKALKNSSYEEVAYLLLYGKLPDKRELAKFSNMLKARRGLPQRIIKMMHTFAKRMTPMEALRTTVSALAYGDPDARKVSKEDLLSNGIGLIAKFPTTVAAYHRIEHGLRPIRPNSKLGHAANFLYMLTGKKPDSISERAFDADLVLHAEHGMNASTFAARVTVSTLSDIHSAITSAVGTLKGPLHGGAAQEVFKMLLKIGSEKNVEKYISAALARHERIMGFGHRVYKTHDPRAVILREMARKLSEQKGVMKWYNMSVKIEDVMMKSKNLYPNVDFYSATVYHLLGVHLELDTPIFAISRIAGWVAHVMEQTADNRLIRPTTVYTGLRGLKFVPIERR